MKLTHCVVFLSLAATATASKAVAAPARFWLSTMNTVSTGPEVPDIEVGLTQAPRRLYIWARPQTDTDTDEFEKLQNVSLNIAATEASPSQPAVDFLDGPSSISVLNDLFDDTALTGQERRFQFVNDSTTGLTSLVDDGSAPDLLANVLGFSINSQDTLTNPVTNYVGLGRSGTPVCHGDPDCLTTDTGAAWLLGYFEIDGISLTGGSSTSLHLQIGSLGITHAEQSSSDTTVVFGTDATPTYDAASDRETTKAGDTADAVIRVAAGPVVGDMNGDGAVNFGDLSPFTKGLTDQAGYAVEFPGLDRVSRCDASGDGKCNFSDLSPFAALLTSGSGAAVANVPEPGGAALLCAALLIVSRWRAPGRKRDVDGIER